MNNFNATQKIFDIIDQEARRKVNKQMSPSAITHRNES